MFKVGGYKVTFERIADNTYCVIESTAPEQKSSLLCPGEGVAHLHPNDRPDKIIGKKVALRKAIANSWFRDNKQIRTMIWKAFWNWVADWPNAGKKN